MNTPTPTPYRNPMVDTPEYKAGLEDGKRLSNTRQFSLFIFGFAFAVAFGILAGYARF